MATKISVYLEEDVANDMKLLIKHEGTKITDFVNTSLKKYIESKSAELELARKQEREWEEIRRQKEAYEEPMNNNETQRSANG